MNNNNGLFNQDMLDFLSVMSFFLGIANYQENLSQSDKDDMMHQLDEKTNAMLTQIEADLDEQNKLLYEILNRLKRLEGEKDA